MFSTQKKPGPLMKLENPLNASRFNFEKRRYFFIIVKTIVQTFYQFSSPPNPYLMEQNYTYPSLLKGQHKVTVQLNGKFLQDTMKMEVLRYKELVLIKFIVQWHTRFIPDQYFYIRYEHSHFQSYACYKCLPKQKCSN